MRWFEGFEGIQAFFARGALPVLAATVLAVSAVPAAAEPISYFKVDGISYNTEIPTPESVLRHELGEKPVRHARLVDYLRKVAAASDRLTVETIGYSHEGRPILFLVATSPENHGRLDEIRAAQLARTDPSTAAPDDENAPVVVWLNYGVHGAESSGMDASLPVAWHLAAAQGPEIEEMLSNSVILISAVFNPDGHSRRVDHVYKFSSEVPVTNPDHAQHRLWLEARTNHYWFDLNRQWLLQTQPESRAWMRKWHEWKPNVSADYHEMGSDATYYFHPGEPKRKNPLIPDRERELLKEISKRHAEFMDSEARLYYSEERFDNFYIGKGSTYPSINGSVGILFEAAAARGGKVEGDNGIRTYADNIRTHFRTSLTTIQGGLNLREELLTYQRAFFEQSVTEAGGDMLRAFVFKTQGDRARLLHFVDLLRRHDVKVYRLARDVRINNERYTPGDSFIVPVQQPQYRMIRGLFDRLTEFEENIFYDVSGWTLPLAYDLTYHRLIQGGFGEGMLGEEASPELPVYEPPPQASYGYMFDWAEYYAPRAAYRLMEAGVRMRTAFRPLTVDTAEGEVEFGRGAIFVPLVRQDVDAERIHQIVSEIAAEDSVRVHAVTSGLTPIPGGDLGAPISLRTVKKPSVLLIYGDGLISYDVGEVWHLLDHRMRMPVVLRKKDDLGGIDWSDYTHIILSGGWEANLDEETTERLGQWIKEEGGVLIGVRQGAEWAQGALLEKEKKESEEGEKKPESGGEKGGEGEEKEPLRYDYADKPLRDAEHVVGGAIFSADLDNTHPIGFGYGDRMLPLHRNTDIVLKRPEEDPFATVVQYAEEPLLTGYASKRRQEEVSGEPAVVARRLGAGTVVLYADNPNFRGTFLGTSKLFLNAIFFGDLIEPAYGDYEP
ncbi:MAG: M14 family zinc carboxypeptidase [Alphaproteobacteria bacterium]